MAKNIESTSDFIENVLVKNKPELREKFNNNLNIKVEKTLDENFKFFMNGFCEMCGISLGYRSVYWDLATIIATDITQSEFPNVSDLAQKHIINWHKYSDYDCGLMIEPTISIGLKMIETNEIEEENLPLFCQTLKRYIVENDEYADQINLLYNLIGHLHIKV